VAGRLPADHRPHHLIDGGRFSIEGGDVMPVAQHGDAVAQAKDFRQTM